MSNELGQLAGRIRNELVEVERVRRRTETGWQRARQSGDDYYLDGVALNLHGFYSGLERIFELIATRIDGKLPTGENWHQMLLKSNDCRNLRCAPGGDFRIDLRSTQ